MSIRNFFILSTLFLSISPAFSQYTELINTNRPGMSQGAFAVGRDVIQLESGLSYGRENHKLLNTELSAFAIDYTLRYGVLFEQLELQWSGEFQASEIAYTNTNPEIKNNVSNFKSNVVGIKYLLYDPNIKRQLKGPNLYSWKANNKFQWSDLIPAVSFFAGVNFDLDTDNPYLPEGNASISPKLLLSTQSNLKNGLVFVTNLYADRIISEYPSYGYIVTLTKNTGDLFSFFVENQGIISDFYADQLIRGGGAFLMGKDFQVDLAVTYSFKDTPTVLYGRIGAAYRFDMHKKDDYLEEMELEKQELIDSKNKRKEKGKKKSKNKNQLPEDLDLSEEEN